MVLAVVHLTHFVVVYILDYQLARNYYLDHFELALVLVHLLGSAPAEQALEPAAQLSISANIFLHPKFS